MKKNILNILILLLTTTLCSQSQFRVIGDLHIHEEGQLAFHTDLINDGNFDQNLGTAVFFNQDRPLTISGNNTPVFYDMITHVSQDLQLDVSVGITHFKEFLSGRILTPRNDLSITLDFRNDTPYMGEENERHVDGYVSNTGLLDFTFPIGDDFRLRPMKIDPVASQNTSKGAYFFENPNDPSTFTDEFNTTNLQPSLSVVSPFEFWDLDSNTATKVTLTWDPNSNIPFLVNELNNLRVVGWSKTDQKWINLGNTNITGNKDMGEITSETITPNDYEIITLGSSESVQDTSIEIFNGITPNGDEKNDTFFIQGIEQNKENELMIYNRWGVLVYHKKGYDNSWNGISEGRITINDQKSLPSGTYFYVLLIADQKNRSGYLYLNN